MMAHFATVVALLLLATMGVTFKTAGAEEAEAGNAAAGTTLGTYPWPADVHGTGTSAGTLLVVRNL